MFNDEPPRPEQKQPPPDPSRSARGADQQGDDSTQILASAAQKPLKLSQFAEGGNLKQPSRPQPPGGNSQQQSVQPQPSGSTNQGGGTGGPLLVRLQNDNPGCRQAVEIPLFLAIVAAVLGLVFGLVQAYFSFQLSDHQHNNDLALAAYQQRETSIENYTSSMFSLFSNTNLRKKGQNGDDLRSLARVQTLTVLNELKGDGVRKARVMQFLHDADLINRGTSTLSVPVVSLDGADFSGALLHDFNLGGADLAAANLSGADLSRADLMGVDLDQANLTGVMLNNAKLDFSSLVGADLRCTNPPNSICTDLTQADLGGADFTGAMLAGAKFNDTDVSGTNPQSSITEAIKANLAYTTPWKVIIEHHTLTVFYVQGISIYKYGILDLNTSKLQLIYGPLGNPGASVVLFPAIWSNISCPGDYCQTAPVTGGSYSQLAHSDLSQSRSLSFTVSGTIANLSIVDTLTFYQPMQNSIAVKVSATSTGTIALDTSAYGNPLPGGSAFEPVILTAMYDSADTWTAKKAQFGNQSPLSLTDANTRIPPPTQPPIQVTSFTMIGGTSKSVTNAPTVLVTLDTLEFKGTDLTNDASVTLQVQSNSDTSVDNVSMWLGLDSPADAWSYKVTASMPS